MPVSPKQVEIAKRHLVNVPQAAAAADATKLPFSLLCAVLDKESDGRNVYGHDAGGALSGYPEDVDESNWRVFWWLVNVKKQASNGVGPMQITYPGFFPVMLKAGLKPWLPADNMLFGARLLRDYLTAAEGTIEERIKQVGTRYNGASAYGTDLWQVWKVWFGRVGATDSPTFAIDIVSAAAVNAATPTVRSPDAEVVQKMLARTKDYTLRVDGLYGPRSKAAFAAWAKRTGHPNKVTETTLAALAGDSGLAVTVTA
jgi:hypothetical protein